MDTASGSYFTRMTKSQWWFHRKRRRQSRWGMYWISRQPLSSFLVFFFKCVLFDNQYSIIQTKTQWPKLGQYAWSAAMVATDARHGSMMSPSLSTYTLQRKYGKCVLCFVFSSAGSISSRKISSSNSGVISDSKRSFLASRMFPPSLIIATTVPSTCYFPLLRRSALNLSVHRGQVNQRPRSKLLWTWQTVVVLQCVHLGSTSRPTCMYTTTVCMRYVRYRRVL